MAETDVFVVGGEPKDLLVDEAHRRLFVSDFTGDSVAVVDLSSGLVVRRLSAPGGPVGLALSSDGTTLFVAAYLGDAVYRIDVPSGRTERTATGVSAPWDVALVSSQGRALLAVTEHHADQVTFLDAQGFATVGSVPTDYYPYQLTVDEAAHRLYVTSYGGRDGGQIAAIDLDTLKRSWKSSSGQGSYDAAVDVAHGVVIVSDFTGQTLSRFSLVGDDAGAGQVLSGGPKSLLLSPDGSTVYAALQTLDRVQGYDSVSGTTRYLVSTGSRPGALAWWPAAEGRPALMSANQGDGTISILTGGPAAPVFGDVASSDPNYRAIRALAARGVLNGYESGGEWTYRPEGTLMRAQLAKIMVGALRLHTEVVELGGVAFADVPAERDANGALRSYPYDYVQEANRAGIVTGFLGQPPYFKPYQAVTRIQLLRMAVRAAAAVGSPLPEPHGPSPFFDITPGHPDYRTALQAYEAGLIAPVVGSDGRSRLSPYAVATRGVTAGVIFDLMGALHRGATP